jgi:hypothetical protein
VLRLAILFLVLCASGICVAQSSTGIAQSAQFQPKHFRLTFVVTYLSGQQPSQSLMLDVPVIPGRPGVSSMALTSGTAGHEEGSVQENLRCAEVRESAVGLSADVTFTIDRISQEPLPGTSEPVHNQMTFQKKIDLVLGETTLITEAAHAKPLGANGSEQPNALPAPPQITVTAVEP